IDPACSIVFEVESEEADVMRRPPRAPNQRLLSRSIVIWGLLQGLLALLIVGGIYLWDVNSGASEADIRELSFATLVLVNLGLVLVNRSYRVDWLHPFKHRNAAFLLIAGGAVAVLALAITVKPVEALFGFGTFHFHDLAIVAVATVLMIAVLEALKGLLRRKLTT
ncbi:MAG: cation-translocating P-type ATPase C-terminal domain-containing protein, partial [Alphaproteobacteria bacterium]